MKERRGEIDNSVVIVGDFKTLHIYVDRTHVHV